VLSDNQVVSND
jgi:hypothetical protein